MKLRYALAGLAFGASAFSMGSASALPMGLVKGPSNMEQVRLVCDQYGRCYRSRPRRVYSGYGYGPSYYGGYYGPSYYGGYGYGGPAVTFGFGGGHGSGFGHGGGFGGGHGGWGGDGHHGW